MKLREIRNNLREDKKNLFTGMALMCFGAVLVLLVIKADLVGKALSKVWGALTPAAVGIVIAYILNVFVHFFEDIAFRPLARFNGGPWGKVRRPAAILLAYLVVAGVVVFITCFIIPELIRSVSTIAETAQKTVPGHVNSWVSRINDFARKNDLGFLQDYLAKFDWSSLLSKVTKVTTDFLSSLISVTFNLATGVFSAIMSFILSVYMLIGREKLIGGVRSVFRAYLPEGVYSRVIRVGTMANGVFTSFIRGQLTECVILGTLCYIGMSILGLDYALLISSVVALGALIPILGAYMGAAVGVTVLLIVQPVDSLIFLIFLVILQQVEGNLIYPRVVGSSIGLPPVWTLFAVLFWGSLLGIPGVVIGTPATAVLYRLLKSSVRERLEKKDGEGPSAPARENEGENL